MIGRLGAAAEASFLVSMSGFDIELPSIEDWPRIAELVTKYADLPLGGTDASVVVAAERLDTDLVITLDSDFNVVRPKHCQSFQLLPG